MSVPSSLTGWLITVAIVLAVVFLAVRVKPVRDFVGLPAPPQS